MFTTVARQMQQGVTQASKCVNQITRCTSSLAASQALLTTHLYSIVPGLSSSKAGFHSLSTGRTARKTGQGIVSVGSKRNIMLHEYQSAQLVHKYMIPIPLGQVAFTAKEAFVIGRKFGPDFNRQFVVKAQVQGVARTKGVFRENGFTSGIHTCTSLDQVREAADMMLGKHLILPGEDENGLMCNSVLVMEHLEIDQQFFLSISLDRKTSQPVITYSDVGGLSLPRLKQLYPERIFQIQIDYQNGIDFVELSKIAEQMGIPEKSTVSFMVKNLYECFLQRDCLEIQINPLVITPQRKFVAANTFIHLDDDALYRQQELCSLIDYSQMSASKRIAFNMDVKYTDLKGNIGVACNSAGLCMSTNDMIKTLGGESANFADVGGSAIHESIDSLLHLLNENDRVKVIFINVYGGLTNVKKVIATLKMCLTTGVVTKPVVIRALGNESENFDEMLGDWRTKHPIFIEQDFEGACQRAVDIAAQEEQRLAASLPLEKEGSSQQIGGVVR